MNRQKFYAALRQRNSGVFGMKLSQQQVDGIEGILDAFVSHGDGRAKTLAYALATAYHEVGGRMVPVREGFARTDAGARQAVNKLAKQRGLKSAVAKYAKPQPPHGHVYYGRGYVQLTWIDNYRKSSADAGVDLVKNPDAVLDPAIGARILIKGLIDGRWNGSPRPHSRKGIAHYLPTNGADDLRNARRTVNITDKWDLIAGYYRGFLKAIEAAGGVPKSASAPMRQQAPQEPIRVAETSPQIALTYTVRSGDTLTRIASRHGVTVQDLAVRNEIADINLIRVGQVLQIPAA